jgi:hypothetical protein
VLVEWLSEGAEGFGFELTEGILCVARDVYLTDPESLEILCGNAAYIARALQKESREAADSGSAVSQGARSEAPDPNVEKAIATVVGDQVPDRVGATRSRFARYLRKQPESYRSIKTLLASLGIAVIFSWLILTTKTGGRHHHHHHKPGTTLFGGSLSHPRLGDFIFLGVAFLVSYAVIQGIRIGKEAKGLDRAAFYRAFARSRGLAMEDSLGFAATHAEAGVPFEPDFVLSGDLAGGRSAALAVKGDGSGRKDRIAVVAGPAGPFAWSQLTTKAGSGTLSFADLDYYVDWLGKQLTGPPASA